MECPNCEKVSMKEAVKDIPYTYKGKHTLISKVSGELCPACGEFILSREESKRINLLLKEFVQTVNAEGASGSEPQFINSVRKKLKLDQKEAGEIFGGGANAFSRYETGRTKPPVAVVKLLRLLDKHPELLPEIR